MYGLKAVPFRDRVFPQALQSLGSTLWWMLRTDMAGSMFPRKDFFRHGLHSTTRWSSRNPRCNGIPSGDGETAQ
jgi:hypothetical protein